MIGLSVLSQRLYSNLLARPHHSRIHPLKSFSRPGCYVKREDELGFGISGSKLRKYLSLFPAILESKASRAVVTGGAHSNHVLSMCQLLREYHIEPVLFLLGSAPEKKLGNFLWTSLFAKEENIHWLPKGSWEVLDEVADQYVAEKKQEGINVYAVPKGGNAPEALKGAATLALDIVRNEQEEQILFDHIVVDAGTGFTACALLDALAYMGKTCWVHVIQVAGTKNEFQEMLASTHGEWEKLIGNKCPLPSRYTWHAPRQASSFGNVNRAVLATVRQLAMEEGFLTDPIYGAKMFAEGKALMQEEGWEGNVLFIHSGGGLGLSGFMDRF